MTTRHPGQRALRVLVLCALALLAQAVVASQAEAVVSVPAEANTLGPIPDAAGTRDVQFDVGDLPPGSPQQVSVILGIQHPNVGDLSVTLIAPNGAEQTIFAYPGEFDPSNLDGRYVFTNRAPATPTFWQAALDASNDAVITPDRYRASVPYGSPDQGANTTIDFPTVTNPNGVWTLRVTDSFPGFSGTVSFARLNIQPAEEAADASTLGAVPDGTDVGAEHYGAPRDLSFNLSGLSDGAPSDVAVGMTFSPAHPYAGDLDVVLIAPDGSRGTVFSRTGAAAANAAGSPANLAGPYRFSDSAQTATSWWAAAQAAGASSAIPAGSYRTSQAGGQGSTGAATSLTSQFAGVTNPNGVWTLRVRDGSVNDVGGVSAASLKVTGAVDSSAPSAPILTDMDPDSPSSSNFPVFSGTADAGSSIRVYTNGVCSGTPTVVTETIGSGFGIQLTVPSDTTTSISVTAYDSSGNISPCSNALVYVEDSTSPVQPTLATVPTPVNDNHPVFHGSDAEPGSVIRIYANEGSPSCTGLPIELGSGADFNGAGIPVLMPDDHAYKITVSAVDGAGNESACSNAIDFEEDSSIEPPSINGTLPDFNANDNSPRFFGSADQDVVKIDLYKTANCSGSPFATGTRAQFTGNGVQISVRDNTETTLRGAATDDAGNVSACSDPFTYVEDSKRPDTKVLSKPKRLVKTSAKKVKFRIKFEADIGGAQRHIVAPRRATSGFRCKLDKGPFKACTSPFSGKVKPGRHTVLISATDAARNTEKSPAKVTWMVKRKK